MVKSNGWSRRIAATIAPVSGSRSPGRASLNGDGNRFDGILADIENLPNLFIAPAVCHILQNLELSFRKLGGCAMDAASLEAIEGGSKESPWPLCAPRLGSPEALSLSL